MKTDSYNQLIEYNIKQTMVRHKIYIRICIYANLICLPPCPQMFKGPERNFDAVYTASSSAICGVTLKKGTMYLLMGKECNNSVEN